MEKVLPNALWKPSESLRSLLLKPKFDVNIIYYFNQHDFHPKPGVDVVLFHIKKNRSQIYLLINGKLMNILSLQRLSTAFAAYLPKIN